MIATLLGASGLLAEYIAQHHEGKDLPAEVCYACALICGNMIALTSDSKNLVIAKIPDTPYEMGEQTQERIYRRMKWIIEELYKQIQEDEKE